MTETGSTFLPLPPSISWTITFVLFPPSPLTNTDATEIYTHCCSPTTTKTKKNLACFPENKDGEKGLFLFLAINSLKKKNEILHRSSELSSRVLEQPTSLSIPRSRHANINHFLFFVFSRYVSLLVVQKYSRKSDQEKYRMTKQADVKRGFKMHHNPDIPYGNVRPSTGKLKPKVSCIFPLFLEKKSFQRRRRSF